MADTKISALTAATTPLAGTEVLPIVQGGVTKKVSVDNLTAGKQGTFTPAIEGTGTAGVGTYSVQLGVYTKIGNVVHFKISIDWSAHTGAGDIKITGLPHVTANDAQITIAALRAGGIAYTAGASLAGQIQPNDTIIYPVTSVSLAPAATIPMSASGNLNVSGIYFTQS
jgi:hypothetical protein